MKVSVSLIDIVRISPLLVLLLTSIIPITIKVLRGNREQAPMTTLIQSLIGVFLAAVLCGFFSLGYIGPGLAFMDALVFDGISVWIGLIIVILTGVTLVMIYDSPVFKGKQFSEAIFLTLSTAIGALILIWANDLLVTFIGLEVMSLPLYLLIAMSNEKKLSKEAALKYFILGSFASAVFLFGVSFIFGSVGSTSIPAIQEQAGFLISNNRIFIFGFIFLISGFCFKVGIFPFHSWAPDVYQGSPTPITAYMSTAIKTVSFVAFLRIIATQGLLIDASSVVNFMVVLQWLAVTTMIAGNVAAIMQNNFKRMLAYSSVAHSGYAFVGLVVAATSTGSTGALGASGLIFYLFSYSIMTMGAFALVSYFEHKEDVIFHIDDLKGYASRRPGVALSLSILLFSLAGLPPTLGFFSKFYLFASAVDAGFYWMAIWGVLNSVISVYYYLRPIVVMYMKDETSNIKEAPATLTRWAVYLSAILILAFGLFSEPFYRIVETAVRG